MADAQPVAKDVISFEFEAIPVVITQHLAEEVIPAWWAWQLNATASSSYDIKKVRTTVEAYKAALLMELMFSGKVAPKDLATRLINQNEGHFESRNFEIACTEVKELLASLE